MQIVRSAHESSCTLTVVCNNRILSNDLKIIATRVSKRVEADAIAIQHSESDLAVIKPLLKDLLRLKRSDGVLTLDEALASRDAGLLADHQPSVAPDPRCLEAAACRAGQAAAVNVILSRCPAI